jgi:stearoyl-CoA desaturase (delta-9 desaturase)
MRVATALRRWIDAGASAPAQTGTGIDWPRVLPFLLVHAGCLGVLWTGASAVAVATAIGLFWLRMFAITAFYHRYFSHRAFRTSRTAQFLFAVLGATAVQRGPLWWAAHHRQHHAQADGEGDAHSPKVHGFLWSHVGWFLARENFATRQGPWQMLVWGFCISTVALCHGTFTNNSLAHRFGSRRYATRDDSRNNPWLALLTLGEGWHNNHHRYPAAARQGFYWWEIDLSYFALRLLQALGIVWDLRPVPLAIRDSHRDGVRGGGR